MKTIKKLKEENQSLFDQFPPPHLEDDKEFKQACKTVAYNNLAILALEVEGIHQLRLETDLKKLKEQFTRLTDNFDNWELNTSALEQTKSPKANYERLTGLKDIAEKIKFIQYLLE